jgi:transposase-like protein
MVVTKQTIQEAIQVTQVQFTFSEEEIQQILQSAQMNEGARLIIEKIINELMEYQRDAYIKAEKYERESEERTSYRNGYYTRQLNMNVGKIELQVPRTRDGEFSTDIFERYQRNEKALTLAILEMYVNGVATRKVTKIVEEMGGLNVSKSFVSNLAKKLDPMIEKWRNRPLQETTYPYIITDVVYLKVREQAVVSKACHIAIGITESGDREILGFMLTEGESYDTWATFFHSLLSRGLSGLKMVITDAHAGEIKAIKECFTGVTWQRCQVHFERNIFDVMPKKNSAAFREEIKSLFRMTDIDQARKRKQQIFEEYEQESRYQKALNKLDEGFEDAFQYCVTANGHRRLKSTNLLERLNKEIRRREKPIGIFPNDQAAIRLIGALLMDQNDEYMASPRQYIKMEKVK